MSLPSGKRMKQLLSLLVSSLYCLDVCTRLTTYSTWMDPTLREADLITLFTILRRLWRIIGVCIGGGLSSVMVVCISLSLSINFYFKTLWTVSILMLPPSYDNQVGGGYSSSIKSQKTDPKKMSCVEAIHWLFEVGRWFKLLKSTVVFKFSWFIRMCRKHLVILELWNSHI